MLRDFESHFEGRGLRNPVLDIKIYTVFASLVHSFTLVSSQTFLNGRGSGDEVTIIPVLALAPQREKYI